MIGILRKWYPLWSCHQLCFETLFLLRWQVLSPSHVDLEHTVLRWYIVVSMPSLDFCSSIHLFVLPHGFHYLFFQKWNLTRCFTKLTCYFCINQSHCVTLTVNVDFYHQQWKFTQNNERTTVIASRRQSTGNEQNSEVGTYEVITWDIFSFSSLCVLWCLAFL